MGSCKKSKNMCRLCLKIHECKYPINCDNHHCQRKYRPFCTKALKLFSRDESPSPKLFVKNQTKSQNNVQKSIHNWLLYRESIYKKVQYRRINWIHNMKEFWIRSFSPILIQTNLESSESYAAVTVNGISMNSLPWK